MKQLLAYCLSIILCVSFTGCMENYLDLYPEDKITSASFPENESDIKLLLNGVYAQLREKEVYNQGLFGFGITDGATPNAFNWGTDEPTHPMRPKWFGLNPVAPNRTGRAQD